MAKKSKLATKPIKKSPAKPKARKPLSSTPLQIKAQLNAQVAAILSEGLVLESFNHRGVRGIEREEPIRRFLRSHLPGRFQVGQGSIASSEIILNRQHDIIVADSDLCFMLLNTVAAQLMIIESVHLIVEVRSRHGELAEVAKSLRRVRELKSLKGLVQLGQRGSEEGITAPPVHTVIMYKGPKNEQTLVDALKAANAPDIKKDARFAIDFILVLSSEGKNTADSGYMVGYGRKDYSHHYYPKTSDVGLAGPKVLNRGRDSFAFWYAAILQHLGGVIAYPPIMHEYLGVKMAHVTWTDKT